MPALPPADHVLKVAYSFKLGTDPDAIVRTFWGWGGSPPTAAGLQSLCTLIGTDWASHFAQWTAPVTVLNQISIEDLTSPSSQSAVVPMSHPGTGGGNAMPAGAALLVNYVVGRRYRGGKPSSYWPVGTDQLLADPQHWTPSAITNFQAAVDGHFNYITGITFPGGTNVTQQRNISYYAGVYPPVTLPSGRVKQASKPRDAVQNDPIISRVVNPIVGSQRRRYTR